MSISILSTWVVGILNGYKKNEESLPKAIPYTTMSLATTLTSFKVINNIPKLSVISLTHTFGSVLLITALGIGSVYCMGNQVGKALAK